MSSSLVLVAPGPITTLRLDNPPLNLVTAQLTRDLDRALDAVESDEAVRAVVVAATGDRAFCAGSDIKEFAGLHGRVVEGKLAAEHAAYNRLAALPVPTVAAIEGDALGGGLELAMCCDLRVASASARFGLPEVTLGVMPGSGGTQRLPRLVGLSRAKELILLGELIDAATAMTYGLVNRVVPPGTAENAAGELAGTIAERAPVAVREAKALLDAALDRPLHEGLAQELEASERVFSTDDMLEGSTAFVEKRQPRFDNR